MECASAVCVPIYGHCFALWSLHTFGCLRLWFVFKFTIFLRLWSVSSSLVCADSVWSHLTLHRELTFSAFFSFRDLPLPRRQSSDSDPFRGHLTFSLLAAGVLHPRPSSSPSTASTCFSSPSPSPFSSFSSSSFSSRFFWFCS